MSLASGVRARGDGDALTGCRRNKSWIQSWAEEDHVRIAALRVNMLRLLRELWPMSGDITLANHVAVASTDLEKIPDDLLDELSATLAKQARLLSGSDAAASGAHDIMAGWLTCRWLEMRLPTLQRNSAKRLKADYERYIRDLVCVGRSAAA